MDSVHLLKDPSQQDACQHDGEVEKTPKEWSSEEAGTHKQGKANGNHLAGVKQLQWQVSQRSWPQLHVCLWNWWMWDVYLNDQLTCNAHPRT